MNQVSLTDYLQTGGSENGLAGQDNGELLKAMQAGQITGRETTDVVGGYEPLKIESLERTLKSLEFRQKDIKLWNAITKLPAYNTVEEFAQLVSYGDTEGGFYQEGELSDVIDSQYTRKAEKVKYLQISGEVTIQAQMVRGIVDAMRQEVENKMMRITGLANQFLTSADERYVPDQFNSIYAQHSDIGSNTGNTYSSWANYYDSDVVIDMRGKSLTQLDIEKASVIIDSHYGVSETLFGPTSVISGVSQDYYEKQRILLNGSAVNATAGMNVKNITTTLGDVSLNADKFLRKRPAKKLSAPASSAKAPTSPVTGAVAIVANAVGSKYESGDAGDVFYAVAAENRYGQSGLTLLGSGAASVVTGAGVDLTFTPGAGGSSSPTGYQIYRTKVTTSTSTTTLDFYPLFKVSVSELTNGAFGAAAGKVRDLGYILPGMEEAFIGSVQDEVMSFKQLAPISKLDLAVVGPSRKFMIFLYGTPQLYTPKKLVRFINVNPNYLI